MTNQLMAVKDVLATKLQEEASAMPQNFNQTRFLQNCLSVLRDTKELDQCEPESVVATMLKGAYLGLDFFNKECYAIPYNKNIGTKERPKWVKDLQFQTDYKGEIKLSKKYSTVQIRDIFAKVIREGDEFEAFVKDGKQYLNFKPKLLSDAPMLGAFAVIFHEDGSMLYDVMTKKEIEKTRDAYSKAPDSKMWKNSPGEAWKKTVLRRLTKLVSLDFDNHKQQAAFEAGAELQLEAPIDVTPPNPFKDKDPDKQAAPKDEKPKDDPFSKPPSEAKVDADGKVIE